METSLSSKVQYILVLALFCLENWGIQGRPLSSRCGIRSQVQKLLIRRHCPLLLLSERNSEPTSDALSTNRLGLTYLLLGAFETRRVLAKYCGRVISCLQTAGRPSTIAFSFNQSDGCQEAQREASRSFPAGKSLRYGHPWPSIELNLT